MASSHNRSIAWAYENLKIKYIKLFNQTQKIVLSYNKMRRIVLKLFRNNAILKKKYFFLQRHVSTRVRRLMEQVNQEKFQIVFTENRKIVSISSNILDDLAMTKTEFENSFYVDILFEKFLPQPDRSKQKMDITPFIFPLLVEEEWDEEVYIHPFIHLRMSGNLVQENGRKRWLYYLNAVDVTSNIELSYFMKTDTLIKNLSITNVNLQKAKKSIEMHKTMLISLVCSLVGEYSSETSMHLKNLQYLTSCISAECKRLGLIKTNSYDIDEYIKDINYTSVLHDIGKMAIPAELLEKDGELSDEEFALVRSHPEVGAGYIKRIMETFLLDPAYSSYISFLLIPWQICMYHHEHWDGRGYPQGLKGQDIPMPARIVAVSDTYEAMRGKRVYNHKPRTHEEACRAIASQAGMQFDPDVVEAFLNVSYRFADLFNGDDNPDMSQNILQK